MSVPILNYQTAGDETDVSPITLLEKHFYIGMGVILPLVFFGLARVEYLFEQCWQFGGWKRDLVYTADGRAGFPFYPLLIYSMSALCVFVTWPELCRLLIVRLGLYTGIVLGLQYSVIQAVAICNPQTFFSSEFIGTLIIALASNFVLLAMVKAIQVIPSLFETSVALSVVVGILVAGCALFIPMLSLFLAPAWFTGTYAKASILGRRLHLERLADRSISPIHMLAWLSWLLAYVAAWKWSIANAITLYAALPTTPPGLCYIATAASGGHPGFVGSTVVRGVDGYDYRVNTQLRRLKCVEIAIAEIWPAGHRLLRRVYDLAGPPLARVIRFHPLLGDLAFAALKPIEWVAFGILSTAVPQVRETVQRIYS